MATLTDFDEIDTLSTPFIDSGILSDQTAIFEEVPSQHIYDVVTDIPIDFATCKEESKDALDLQYYPLPTSQTQDFHEIMDHNLRVAELRLSSLLIKLEEEAPRKRSLEGSSESNIYKDIPPRKRRCRKTKFETKEQANVSVPTPKIRAWILNRNFGHLSKKKREILNEKFTEEPSPSPQTPTQQSSPSQQPMELSLPSSPEASSLSSANLASSAEDELWMNMFSNPSLDVSEEEAESQDRFINFDPVSFLA